jgi:hypothetical protein
LFIDYSNPFEYQVNIRASPEIVKQYARADALNGGMTDTQAEALQKSANLEPISWSYLRLLMQATRIWKSLQGPIEQVGAPYPNVVFNLVMIIRSQHGSTEDHLVASFTCIHDTYQLCDEDHFEQLPDFNQHLGSSRLSIRRVVEQNRSARRLSRARD